MQTENRGARKCRSHYDERVFWGDTNHNLDIRPVSFFCDICVETAHHRNAVNGYYKYKCKGKTLELSSLEENDVYQK